MNQNEFWAKSSKYALDFQPHPKKISFAPPDVLFFLHFFHFFFFFGVSDSATGLGRVKAFYDELNHRIVRISLNGFARDRLLRQTPKRNHRNVHLTSILMKACNSFPLIYPRARIERRTSEKEMIGGSEKGLMEMPIHFAPS